MNLAPAPADPRPSSPDPPPRPRTTAAHPHTQVGAPIGPTHAYPLRPGLAPWLRADGAIQFGTDPMHAVALAGLMPGERTAVAGILRILLGATGPVPVDSLAASSGLSVTRVREVVAAIAHADLTQPQSIDAADHVQDGLDPWPLARRFTGQESTMAIGQRTLLTDRRAGSRVVVDGRGSLVDFVGQLLRAAQVGTVRTGWYAGVSEEHDRTSPDPTLVVTVGRRLPQTRAADWVERGIAVLPVVAHGGSVDIGPVLIAGHGPCIECIRLGAGPALLADLLDDDTVRDGQGDRVTVEPTLAGLAAGVIAMLTLGVVDAYPPPVGVRWHTALPLPSLATSSWGVDPNCRSTTHRGPVDAPARTVRGPFEVTMRQ